MDFTTINGIFGSGLDQLNGLMSGPIKYVIAGILGITFLVIIIGLIFSVVKAVKG